MSANLSWLRFMFRRSKKKALLMVEHAGAREIRGVLRNNCASSEA
jgi:hypothetical protein